MATTYTVKKGDTLSQIALANGSSIKGNTLKEKIETLCKINGIKDANYIVIGQKIKFSGDAYTEPTNKTSKPKIDRFGLQSDTDRTMYATWTWSKTNTDHYAVRWYYDTGNGVWFVGDKSDVKDKQSVYTAPSNANKVKFKVKPIAKKHKKNGKEVAYWTADYSTTKKHTFKEDAPEVSGSLDVDIDEAGKLTAEVSNLDVNVKKVRFQVVKNNETVFYTSGRREVTTRHVSFTYTVDIGSEYKVRYQVFTASDSSEWSDYSENIKTVPAAVSKITAVKAKSESSVYLEWKKSTTAETYTIQYTTKKEYFDGSNALQEAGGIETTQYELTGLEGGEEYFFRIRAVNEKGESAWSEIVSVSVGKKPAAPTTWSSTTTVITGEPLTLYWVHNAVDGSSQTYAELELTVGGKTTTQTIKNSTEEDEKDKTSKYVVDTSVYKEGTTILWRVRTKGVVNEYGDWSIQRTIDVYATPTLQLNMTDVSGNEIEVLTQFPFYIRGFAGPSTQSLIGCHIEIVANESYETVDQIGNESYVNQGDVVYSRYFNIGGSTLIGDSVEQATVPNEILLELSAGSIDLENNISYTINCTSTMSSGLNAETSLEFEVAWEDLEYEPNAEIYIDEENLIASIMPYCEDEIDNVVLAVYRREFDGTFTEIATDIPNGEDMFVTDPHPALDFARYRIVATSTVTGAVSYCDLPAIPVGEVAAVIQWDEAWTNFQNSDEDELEEPAWSGSMLKLMYNIDVSDSRKVDVSLVEYIGRAHPVSYYGTQLGETSSWSMEIPKTDKETLYQLRRLSIWKGDVYVREPSGSGYWASISVSFSQTHCELTIPINLSITRVEGGM